MSSLILGYLSSLDIQATFPCGLESKLILGQKSLLEALSLVERMSSLSRLYACIDVYSAVPCREVANMFLVFYTTFTEH